MQTRYTFPTRLPLLARLGGTAVVVALAWKVFILAAGAGCAPCPTSDCEDHYTLNAAKTELAFDITAWSLAQTRPVTGAYFQQFQGGEPGDELFDLGPFLNEIDDEIKIVGTTQLDDWAIDNATDELLAGNIYVTLRTEMYPDGEVSIPVVGVVVAPD